MRTMSLSSTVSSDAGGTQGLPGCVGNRNPMASKSPDRVFLRNSTVSGFEHAGDGGRLDVRIPLRALQTPCKAKPRRPPRRGFVAFTWLTHPRSLGAGG